MLTSYCEGKAGVLSFQKLDTGALRKLASEYNDRDPRNWTHASLPDVLVAHGEGKPWILGDAERSGLDDAIIGFTSETNEVRVLYRIKAPAPRTWV